MKVTLGVLAALLGSTALASAQSGGISGTAGIIGMSLPGIDQGISALGDVEMPDAADDMVYGVMFGADGYVDLGQHGDYNLFIGASGFGAIARGSSSTATTLSGSGVLIVPGYTTPTDFSIALVTGSDGTDSAATSTVTQGGGGETNIVNLPPGNGANYGWGVNPGDPPLDPSFMYGGVFADGAGGRSAAFGAVADEDGNLLVAVGDLTGVVVTQDVTQDVAYYGGDITVGMSGINGTTSVSGYVGPSYLFLGRNTVSTTTVDFPELGAALNVNNVVFPLYSLEREETIATHYLGGVVGGTISTPIKENVVLSIGAEGGLYYTSTTATGTETASVFGGDPSPTPDPTSVTNLNGISLSDDDFAFSLQGNAALTVPVSANSQISFGFGAEYLSRVATLTHGTAPMIDTSAFGAGDDDGALITDNAGTNESLTPIISYGSALNLSGFLTFSGQF